VHGVEIGDADLIGSATDGSRPMRPDRAGYRRRVRRGAAVAGQRGGTVANASKGDKR
jgi:hypothetical protein